MLVLALLVLLQRWRWLRLWLQLRQLPLPQALPAWLHRTTGRLRLLLLRWQRLGPLLPQRCRRRRRILLPGMVRYLCHSLLPNLHPLLGADPPQVLLHQLLQEVQLGCGEHLRDCFTHFVRQVLHQRHHLLLHELPLRLRLLLRRQRLLLLLLLRWWQLRLPLLLRWPPRLHLRLLLLLLLLHRPHQRRRLRCLHGWRRPGRRRAAPGTGRQQQPCLDRQGAQLDALPLLLLVQSGLQEVASQVMPGLGLIGRLSILPQARPGLREGQGAAAVCHHRLCARTTGDTAQNEPSASRKVVRVGGD